MDLLAPNVTIDLELVVPVANKDWRPPTNNEFFSSYFLRLAEKFRRPLYELKSLSPQKNAASIASPAPLLLGRLEIISEFGQHIPLVVLESEAGKLTLMAATLLPASSGIPQLKMPDGRMPSCGDDDQQRRVYWREVLVPHVTKNRRKQLIERKDLPKLIRSYVLTCKRLAELVNPQVPDPHAPYRPADWFRLKYGIPEDRLRGARRTGRLMAIQPGSSRQWLYSVPDAKQIWPDEEIEIPSSSG